MTGSRRSARVWVIPVVAVLAAGCAGPSLGSDADALESEVAGLPGVASARVDYHEPLPVDSGKLALHVEMSRDATPGQVEAVARTAYDAFSSTHRGEEADLKIRAGSTSVALRSFQPEASTTAVSTAVSTGLLATPEGGSVALDLTTDGVPGGDHVAGTYLVTLPAGSTSADIPGLLTSLAAGRPDDDIGWGARAADGSSLSYDDGLPPAPVVDRWERLQEPGVPFAVRALEVGAVFAEGRSTVRYDVDDPADRRSLDTITHPQLRALGDGEWVYTLRGPRGTYLAEIDRYLCLPVSQGGYDDLLEAWATEELGACDPA